MTSYIPKTSPSQPSNTPGASRSGFAIGARATTKGRELPAILRQELPTGKKELEKFSAALTSQMGLDENSKITGLFQERLEEANGKIQKFSSKHKDEKNREEPEKGEFIRRAPAQQGSHNPQSASKSRTTQLIQTRRTSQQKPPPSDENVPQEEVVIEEVMAKPDAPAQLILAPIFTDPAHTITSIIGLLSKEAGGRNLILSKQGEHLADIMKGFAGKKGKKTNMEETLLTICYQWTFQILPRFGIEKKLINPWEGIPRCIVQEDRCLSEAGQEIADILRKHGIENADTGLQAICDLLHSEETEYYQDPSTVKDAEKLTGLSENDDPIVKFIPGIIRFLLKFDFDELLACKTKDLHGYLMQTVNKGRCTSRDPLVQEFCHAFAPLIGIVKKNLEGENVREIDDIYKEISAQNKFKKFLGTVHRIPGSTALLKKYIKFKTSEKIKELAASYYLKDTFPYSSITTKQSKIFQQECAKIVEPILINMYDKHDLSKLLPLIEAMMALKVERLKKVAGEKEDLEKALSHLITLGIKAIKCFLVEIQKDPVEKKFLADLLDRIKKTEWKLEPSGIYGELWDNLVMGWIQDLK